MLLKTCLLFIYFAGQNSKCIQRIKIRPSKRNKCLLLPVHVKITVLIAVSSALFINKSRLRVQVYDKSNPSFYAESCDFMLIFSFRNIDCCMADAIFAKILPTN